MTRKFILRLCYDDSDPMTDYYHPRATFMEWLICDYEGRRTTESKLRRALSRCPEWIRKLTFKYKKTYYDKPYLESEPIGLTKTRTYGGYERPFFFIVEDTPLFSDEGEIPKSIEELKGIVERREREQELKEIQMRERIAKAHADIIKNATAIIDAKGFRILTEQEKNEIIVKAQQDLLKKQKEDVNTIIKKKLYRKDRSKITFYI